MAEEKDTPSFLDRLGPTLTSALVITIGSGVVYGAVAVRDLVVVATNDLLHISAELNRLRADLDSFRKPGDRHTKAEGNIQDQRLDALEQRVQQCGESKAEVITRLDHIEREQDRLCQRIAPCQHNNGR